FTDGGYYRQAEELMDEINPEMLAEKRHQVEWHYRKARLFHKQDQPEKAVPYYEKTIELAAMNEWYYAPNSCLQLGYLAREQGNLKEARRYFEMALSYKR